jgi:hypothetical protein
MRAVAWLVSLAALSPSMPALAETLTCSTWQGIRTCTDAHGYVSHETHTWSTSRWRDIETTTITPQERLTL